MEAISLKMENALLAEIDRVIRKYRYSTRTEFIRDSIRYRLSALEREEAIKELAAMRGVLKGKALLNDEQAGEVAFRKIAKKLNVEL